MSGTVAALVLCEVLLRAGGISYPVLLTADPVTGLWHIPTAHGRYLQEGRAYVRINSRGLRDREHSLAKPDGVFRIIILGDSYSDAFQVEDNEPFWAVMERRLAAHLGRRVEAINFGVSGFGTGSELLALRHRALAYAPDAVVLAFTTANDVSDNVKALKRVDYFPYFTLHSDTLALDSSFVNTAEFRLRSGPTQRLVAFLSAHSRVVQLLNQVRSQVRATQLARSQNRGEKVGGEPGLDALAYRAPSDSLWREAWRVTAALLVAVRDECRKRGIPLYVVTLSNGIQVDPDRARRTRFAEALGVPDLFYPDRRVREIGERSGFEVLNLAPELQREADSTGTYFHGSGKASGKGHWNREGHLRAGTLIADWLADRLLPYVSPSPASSR